MIRKEDYNVHDLSIAVLKNAVKVLERTITQGSEKTEDYVRDIQSIIKQHEHTIQFLRRFQTTPFKNGDKSYDKGYLFVDKLLGASFIVDSIDNEDIKNVDLGFNDIVRLSDSKRLCKGDWIPITRIERKDQ